MSHAASPPGESIEERVLHLVRTLAEELGGARAARLVHADASLERELGLGSLERVELLARLESSFGGSFDEALLRLDTPADLARAITEEPSRDATTRPAGPAAVGAAREAVPVRTIHESLWIRAMTEPDRPHVYLREDDGTERTITYGTLGRAAAAVAGALRDLGVRPGDRVSLMLPTGTEFLEAFQGILLARAVPVPIYPPVRLDRVEEHVRRQSAILRDASIVALITVPQAMGVARLLRDSVPGLDHVVTVGDLTRRGAGWTSPDGDGGDAAFIQYTSGSTGSPKGVLLTHANLLANIRAIVAGLEAGPDDVGASWLPLYHDMGLIGSWLFCMHQGLPLTLQSPLSFLSRPERWLWSIHRHRATMSAAPNFAYELCARRIPDAALEGLDLSSWRCALSGAEPVNPDTLDRFAARFEPYGFRRTAFMPVYGLAENAVALCFPPVGRGPLVDRVLRTAFERDAHAEPAPDGDGTALRFVGVGRALPEHEIRIVDGIGAPLADRDVGRVIFRGPSMTSGYVGHPEATAAITVDGSWLDSGDLGYRVGDEIYIAGRTKDIVIKAGRNLIPQEIEEAVAAVDGVRRGCVAVFGVPHVEHGTETLVVAAETRAKAVEARDALVNAVRARVDEVVGLPPDHVILLAPGSLPKTSSGKIQRGAARALYLAGRLGTRERTGVVRRARIVASAAVASARQRLAPIIESVHTLGVALALVPVAFVLWAVAAAIPGPRIVWRAGRGFSRLAFRLSGCRLAAEGLERLPADGPLILAVNHTSYADILALLALLPRDIRFVAKMEIASWPFLGGLMRKGGHLPIDRLDSQQSLAGAGRIREAIEAGHPVLFFPEGTFVAAAGLRPFKLGAFHLAVETGVPVVPVALRGLRGMLRPGHWALKHGTVRLFVGEPVTADGSDWRAIVRLRDRVADAIAAQCGEPRLDLVVPGIQGVAGE